MQYFFRSFPVALALFLLSPGCGWRTGLDDYSDGSIPSRDAGVLDGSTRDGGRDGGRDAGDVACVLARDCDDGILCNGVEDCVRGRCTFGVPFDCNDGVSCTRDGCAEGVGCFFEPDDAACGPGLRCDTFVGCVPLGGCRSDFDCMDGNICNGEERCNPEDGTCFPGPGLLCPVDDVDCTVEGCDPELGCTSIANGSLCAAGEICDPMAGCRRVPCMSDMQCRDGDPCNGDERCGPGGTCTSGTPLRCDDGVECTLDRCQPGVGCVTSVSPEQCLDGRDNDCNGAVDCEDMACFSRPECGGCMPISRSEFRCTDGADDDCDGAFDCVDPDCAGQPVCGCAPIAPFEMFCDDGRDDDCNGLFDCEDPACAMRPECGACMPIAMREIRCTDGNDDDCDGAFDCGDTDCFGTPACGCVPTARTEIRCRGGVDEDCDGNIDCADTDCARRPACMGMCVPTTANEIGVAECTNGRDDDCDGRLDCADPDCTPFGAGAECCNGRDDNGDGQTDEVTCFCEVPADCVGVGSIEQVCWQNTFSVCAPDCRRVGSDSFCAMFVPDLPVCNRMTGECRER